MNSLFGDASTAAPTPATLAEAESLFNSHQSPMGSFRLAAEDGEPVPDMDLQPPDVEVQNGKPMISKDTESDREGAGGWISNLVKRGKGEGADSSGSGKYKRVGQDDDDR